MSALVFDIETVGISVDDIPDRALEYLFKSLERDDPEPEELERRGKEMISRFGLDPSTGRVIVIGVLDFESGDETAFTDESEKRAPNEILGLAPPISEQRSLRDVQRQALRHPVCERPQRHSRVVSDQGHPCRPANDDSRTSTSARSSRRNDRRRRGSLDYFSCHLRPAIAEDEAGWQPRSTTSYAEGRLDDIVEYCLDDCRATAAIYERLAPFYR